jgi:hypothetical protein
MTESTYPPPDPPEDGNPGQSDEEGEMAPDRPTDDAQDVASSVHEEEAQEQGGR